MDTVVAGEDRPDDDSPRWTWLVPMTNTATASSTSWKIRGLDELRTVNSWPVPGATTLTLSGR